MSTIKLELPRDNALLLEAAAAFFTAAAACAGGVPLSLPVSPMSGKEGVTPAPLEGGSCTEGAIAGAIDAGAEAAGSLFDANAKVDGKGVAFNDEFCGVSKDAPFYGPGPNRGQWKKKRNVAVEAYDAWYASALLALPAADASVDASAGITNAINQADTTVQPTEPAAVDTSTAFGNGTTTTAETAKIPTTGVELIGWTAERQAGGTMQAETLTAAFDQCQVTQAQLFAPNSGAQVAKVYQLLVSWGVPA